MATYSDSPLVAYTCLSPNYTPNRNHSIDTITIHEVWGQCSMETLGGIFAPESRQASSNYGVCTDGIAMFVHEKDRSWCSSDPPNDHRAITIETSNNRDYPNAVSTDVYKRLILLCADICRRNGKSKMIWCGSLSATNSRTFASNEMRMTLHKWFATTDCPGKWLEDHMSDIAKQANNILATYKESDWKKLGDYENIPIPDPVTEDPGSESPGDKEIIVRGETINVDLKIDISKLTPYLIGINRSTPTTINFKNLKKKKKVIGVVIEAGYLYDSAHREQLTFRSSAAYAQVNAVKAAGLDHAFIMPARATNRQEARDEIGKLSYVVNRYPPKLGVWLDLQLKGTNAANDKIMDRYYEDLVRLGLKAKIGIYCNRNTLKKISWKKYQKEWLLWLVDHTNDLSVMDKIFDPMFFDTDGKSGPVWEPRKFEGVGVVYKPISDDPEEDVSYVGDCPRLKIGGPKPSADDIKNLQDTKWCVAWAYKYMVEAKNWKPEAAKGALAFACAEGFGWGTFTYESYFAGVRGPSGVKYDTTLDNQAWKDWMGSDMCAEDSIHINPYYEESYWSTGVGGFGWTNSYRYRTQVLDTADKFIDAATAAGVYWQDLPFQIDYFVNVIKTTTNDPDYRDPTTFTGTAREYCGRVICLIGYPAWNYQEHIIDHPNEQVPPHLNKVPYVEDAIKNIKFKEKDDDKSPVKVPGDKNYLGYKIVQYALKWVGITPYVWAGRSLETGADCSNFTSLIYEHFGIEISGGSDLQSTQGKSVSRADALPGDIVVYQGHVAMYIGNNQIVHNNEPGTFVHVSDIDYMPVLDFRRMI